MPGPENQSTRHDEFNNNRIADLAVLVSLFAFTGWYLWDTWRASSHLYNLVFVLPLTVTIMTLCAFSLVRELLRPAVNRHQEPSPPTTSADSVADPIPVVPAGVYHDVTPSEQQGPMAGATGSLPAIALFVGYVATLPWLGLDVGTFVFIALFLKLGGEGKWQWILAYALAFSLGASLFFSTMLPYDMPLLLIPGGG